MKQATRQIAIDTQGKGLIEFTHAVAEFLSAEGPDQGLLTIFCRHTSASLIIQENADPDVQTDLTRFFEDVAPEGGDYVHGSEGPDDMPAHIRSALTQTQISIPIIEGRMVLGIWQGIYLFEHRGRPHRRNVVLHVMGE